MTPPATPPDTRPEEGSHLQRAKRLALAAFCAVLLADLAYRAALMFHVVHDPVTPYSFVPSDYSVSRLLRASGRDFLGFAPFAAAVFGSVWLSRRFATGRALLGLRLAGWGLCGLGALVLGLVHAAHLRSLLAMHAGLDASLLLDAMGAVSRHDLLDYCQPGDLALLVLPGALLVLFVRLSYSRERLIARTALALTLGCALLVLPALVIPVPRPYPPRLAQAVIDQPLDFLARDLLRVLTRKKGVYERRSDAMPPPAPQAVRFDPLPPAHSPRVRERYNVLLVIMESTGFRYAFDTHAGNAMPMPRLRALADHGLELRRHYATANTSPRAIFSIFTGLYPQPTTNMFCTRPDVRVPGIGAHLGPDYERFFVTPGRLQSYLPRALLQNDGMREIYGYEELPIAQPIELGGGGRSEIQTADFFIERMAKAKEPFFATYYSYAPHFDYFDQGAEFRVFHDQKEPRHRYYNSMRLLDTQIGRFVDELERSGRLEHTVLVLVGDHGEAFGQHEDNFTHSRRSFEENLRVPVVFYQPKLFAPRAYDGVTSHVDLLPTLLDALGGDYDLTRIQGTPLLRGEPARDYVYVWGSEGTLTSIDKAGVIKLQVSFEHNRCTYYDLQQDPREKHVKKCNASVKPQLSALLRYYKLQRDVLMRENRRLTRGSPPRALGSAPRSFGAPPRAAVDGARPP